MAVKGSSENMLLDIGLYAGTERLRETLIEAQGDLALRVIKLNSETAQAADWDAVLCEVLRCGRCITL